jgi:superfamily I DNA and/or RNA helicase
VGLDALRDVGAFHPLEESKRAYIGDYGDAPTLLVQGPPGTGKSYATAFALFARLQGAMAAGRDLRVFVSCKTHAATDVLLHNVLYVQGMLRELAEVQPGIVRTYIDERLLGLSLFRVRPKEAQPAGVTVLPKDEERASGAPTAIDALTSSCWCVVAATPAGVRSLLKDTWKDIFGHELCDLLVLDEASQMNLAEAAMAALPLKPDGQLIVVG